MKKSQKGLELPRSLLPTSMEEHASYLNRFASHPDMIYLFPDTAERRAMAAREFEAKWSEAIVTVTKIDGARFFID